MKYSSPYIFYPDNRALETAIASAVDMLGDEFAEAARPDTGVTTSDNFLHTRGNFEQQRFSTNILASAREVTEASLVDDKREQEPGVWADTQNILGNILAAMAQQQHDTALFEKAIQCFNNALEVISQADSPQDWAEMQANLGTALQALGRLESDAKCLNNSVDAYTSALLVYSKKETPEQWKLIMLQLGATLHAYATLLKGNRTFQKSVVAYKNSIAELDADNYPFELAAAHNNCGAVLHNLAESEGNTERLQEAIRSYETAWKVCMEQQQPIHLAVLCRVNKTTAQSALAELTQDNALADEVADEFELIIECFPHALQPLCLKHCEERLSKMRAMAEDASAKLN
jgi:tetratricopeptide (TPR) repeat protein